MSFQFQVFFFGDEIVEIISVGKVLSNLKRWTIILFFTLFFNVFTYLEEFGFEFGISSLISYLISNSILIIKSIKIPVDTIINLLSKEGFKKEHIEKFLYQKYNKDFKIYFLILGISFVYKVVISKNK